jgi:hypothetical protein
VKIAQLQVAAFSWKVSEAGYEWKKGVDSRPHLFERNIPGKGWWIYQPMIEYPGLFREFAGLEGKQAILEFATRYGVLFNRYSLNDSIAEKGTYRSVGASSGTALKVWEREIEDMRILVDLWDTINNNRIVDLKQVVYWIDRQAEYRVRTPKRNTINESLTLPGVPHRFREGDLLLPARYALQREINKRLSNEVSESDVYKIACVPCVVWNADGSQTLTIMPPNLLGAMWLQFAQFASGAYQLKRCPGCERYFQAGKGARRRADAVTCSDACRQRKRRESVS